ncbi:MAG: LysM peptidoglycan-binding domain-containing protein [bacterium]
MKKIILRFCMVAILFPGLQACSHLNTTTARTTNTANKSYARAAIATQESRFALDENEDLTGTHQITEETVPEVASGDSSDQRLIDEALNLLQTSQDLWNERQADEAIDVLDQSYELILKISPESDSNILQQKEDLRLLISRKLIEIYNASSRTNHSIGDGAIPLVMNEHIEREIKSFQTTERNYFVESYRRSGRYQKYIAAEFRKAGLPTELSWLPLIESGYKDKAFSRARALGLWQFIASTGYRFNMKRDTWVDERMDYQKSTQAAIEYLTFLHDLFGDWSSALAGYNCGEMNVVRAIRKQPEEYLDNFWDLYPALPSETVRYVPRFLATLHIIKNPAKYGFTELVQDAPIQSDTMNVSRQMKIKDIANAISVSPDLLEELNPALRQQITPDYTYTLRLPQKTSELLHAKLNQIQECSLPVLAKHSNYRSYAGKGSSGIHTVRKGETLGKVAAKYRTSVNTLAKLNHIRNNSKIRIGQKLKVPGGLTITTASYKQDTKTGQSKQYKVRNGDTLWSIAKRYNTSVSRIRNANGLSGNALQTGQVLEVPSDS